MALSLLQYANHLDTRNDLSWPAPPVVEKPKAKAHLTILTGIRAVLWNVYGTLIAIPGGDIWFEHPNQFVMDIALDKTIREFKMWGSMSRKPGQPADYLRQIYKNLLDEEKLSPSPGGNYPEVLADHLWESFVKQLMQKDYTFNANFYGSLNEFSRKVSYFFHASIQGTLCYPGAATALGHVRNCGILQGLLADTQCFTLVQLERGVHEQDPNAKLDELLDPGLHICSHEQKLRKPSEKLFRHALNVLGNRGIDPEEVLHIGSRVAMDIIPARRIGMKTGLFAGDKASLQATAKEMRNEASRPDVLLTDLSQISEIIG